MTKKIILLVCILLLGIFKDAYTQEYTFERAIPWKQSETSIFSIVQDHKGFIWFATRDGLWKFNGYSTKEYRYSAWDTTSISSSFIRSLFVDREGILWVGTVGGGLNRYVEEFDVFARYVYEKENLNSLSHNDVLNIYQDGDGYIWACTEDGLNRLDQQTGRFKRYYLEDDPSPQQRNRAILACLETSDGQFWVGSYFRGLFKLNPTNGQYAQVTFPDTGFIPPTNVWTLMEDSHNNLWIGCHRQGVFKMNLHDQSIIGFHTNEKNPHRLSNSIVYQIIEDKSGKIWMGTEYGLNIYDPQKNEMQHFFSEFNNPYSISNNAVWSIYEDNAGTVWLGGWEGFADKWDEQAKRFKIRLSAGIFPPEPLHYNAMVIDKQKQLLVGTNSGLLVVPEFSSNAESHMVLGKDKKVFYEGDYISTILKDRHGEIWVGSNNGLKRFNNNPDEGKTYLLDLPNPSYFVMSLLEDSRGNIWVGTQNGLFKYMPEGDTFKHYQATPFVVGSISHKEVTCLYEDRNGVIWAGTKNGLNRLNLTTGSFTSFHHEHNEPNSLANGHILSLFHDSRGILWVGTSSGLSAATDLSGKFRNFDLNDGLPGNIVTTIAEDQKGRLWISCDEGLSSIEVKVPDNVEDEVKLKQLQASFTNYTTHDGLLDMNFMQNSKLQLPSGELLYGGIKGISSFYPDSIKRNKYVPPVYLTDLRIMNRTIKPGMDNDLLDRHISLVDEIVLNHNHKVVTFDFVALNFTSSEKNQYAYIMKGFDSDWTFAVNNNSATYTNLDPGSYTFMVKASNNDGVWNDSPSIIKVIVKPPPWQTWWAFVGYLVVVAATIFGFARILLAKQKIENSLKLEKVESEKVKEMNYFKSVFFTNISHEFRTPLTLIISPLGELLKSEGISDMAREQIKRIHKNAQRLLRLINQLLDISKVEAGHIKLKVSEGNIVEYLNSVFEAFQGFADKQEIQYRFYSSHDEILAYFDGDKMEKILYNLLSNAFKHTPKGGKIDVLLSLKQSNNEEKGIELIVQDSGTGITQENQNKIFNRFFSMKDSNASWQSSTGIGLSLANQLALVHKGKITVESQADKGSRFIVTIPVDRNKYSKEEISVEISQPVNDDITRLEYIIEHESGSFNSENEEKTNRSMVLIVEDNNEVRDYLVERLSSLYKTATASNGREALEVAIENVPDVIISDLMMPEMDGFELCKKIKSDPHTSHIPFILLTAKAADENEMKGFELGADAYIPKPFQMPYLLTRIDNLLSSRNRLREIFGKRLTLEPSDISLTSIDEKIIKKAVQLIEKHINDQNLNVDVLCQELGMSRSQAYRKLKAITGLSPLELIRSIRIKRAAQILTQKSHSITEAAYMVGFSDLAHFRKCFKEQFKVTPKQYVEELEED